MWVFLEENGLLYVKLPKEFDMAHTKCFKRGRVSVPRLGAGVGALLQGSDVGVLR